MPVPNKMHPYLPSTPAENLSDLVGLLGDDESIPVGTWSITLGYWWEDRRWPGIRFDEEGRQIFDDYGFEGFPPEVLAIELRRLGFRARL